MPRCVAGGPVADADAAERIRRVALEAAQREMLSDMQTALNRLHDLPVVDRRHLETLSITCGPMLDVDNLDSAPPSLHHSKFFMPCTWPQEDLECETWSQDPWRELDNQNPYGSSNLAFPMMRSEWFQGRLDELDQLCPNIWDTYSGTTTRIRGIRLRLPHREFFRRGLHIYHEYYPMWTSLAQLDSDKPHAQCWMLDSADNVTDDVLLRSEAEAAIAMCRYRLRGAYFTHHHTKPVLITTFLRDQKARLTQAYLDSKLNKLLLRQSRLLDLSGSGPGPDAWLLLRWMATLPVGITKYPDIHHTSSAYSDNVGGLALSVVISESPHLA